MDCVDCDEQLYQSPEPIEIMNGLGGQFIFGDKGTEVLLIS